MDFSAFPNEKFSSELPIALGNSIEARSVETFFRGRLRSEITLDLLKSSYPHDPAACLAFMSPEAFAFFLPVFMRIALDNYDTSDAIPDSVVFDLYCMAQGSHNDKLSVILSTYTTEQLGVVGKFLTEMSRKYWHLYPSDDAKKAFLAYWGDVKQAKSINGSGRD